MSAEMNAQVTEGDLESVELHFLWFRLGIRDMLGTVSSPVTGSGSAEWLELISEAAWPVGSSSLRNC